MTQRSRSASRAAALACIAGATLAAGARPREKGPLRGYEVGPRMDRIVPGELVVDPPTLENLGFRWTVQGDSNRNASVAVTYRRKGDKPWRRALPMLRVHHEIANQDYGPFRCGNLFAGSVMFLEPGTAYEVRFEMRDPDGGAAAPKIVTARTRREPEAPTDVRTVHVFPIFHPAAILRNPNQRPMMDADFAALRSLLDEPAPEQGEVTPPEPPVSGAPAPTGAPPAAARGDDQLDIFGG